MSDLLWVNFYLGGKVRVSLHSFACVYSSDAIASVYNTCLVTLVARLGVLQAIFIRCVAYFPLFRFLAYALGHPDTQGQRMALRFWRSMWTPCRQCQTPELFKNYTVHPRKARIQFFSTLFSLLKLSCKYSEHNYNWLWLVQLAVGFWYGAVCWSRQSLRAQAEASAALFTNALLARVTRDWDDQFMWRSSHSSVNLTFSSMPIGVPSTDIY